MKCEMYNRFKKDHEFAEMGRLNNEFELYTLDSDEDVLYLIIVPISIKILSDAIL